MSKYLAGGIEIVGPKDEVDDGYPHVRLHQRRKTYQRCVL